MHLSDPHVRDIRDIENENRSTHVEEIFRLQDGSTSSASSIRRAGNRLSDPRAESQDQVPAIIIRDIYAQVQLPDRGGLIANEIRRYEGSARARAPHDVESTLALHHHNLVVALGRSTSQVDWLLD